jgi:shikimate kinase
MSAIHAIAWGLLELDEANFKRWRAEVRKELQQHKLRIIPTGGGHFMLVKKTKAGGHLKRTMFGRGDLYDVCSLASKILTPSNPTE